MINFEDYQVEDGKSISCTEYQIKTHKKIAKIKNFDINSHPSIQQILSALGIVNYTNNKAMIKIKTISKCPQHHTPNNLLIWTHNTCTLVCPHCQLQSRTQSHYSPNTHTPNGIFLCGQSISYFKQWTTSIITILSTTVSHNFLTSCTNFPHLPPPSPLPTTHILTPDEASRMMDLVLREQIAVFEANLKYVDMLSMEKLTNQLFLTELWMMAMDMPERSLEIIVDKFRKSIETYYAILRVPVSKEILGELKFSSHFCTVLREVTTKLLHKYGRYFMFDGKNVPHFDCFPVESTPKKEENRYEEIGMNVVREEEVMSDFEPDQQQMQESEIIEKKIIVTSKIKKNQPISVQRQLTGQLGYQTPKKIQRDQKDIERTTQTKQIFHQLSETSKRQQQKHPNRSQHQLKTKASPLIQVNNIVTHFEQQNRRFKELKEGILDQIHQMSHKVEEIHCLTPKNGIQKMNVIDFGQKAAREEVEVEIQKIKQKQKQLEMQRQREKEREEIRQMKRQLQKQMQRQQKEKQTQIEKKKQKQRQKQRQAYKQRIEQLQKDLNIKIKEIEQYQRQSMIKGDLCTLLQTQVQNLKTKTTQTHQLSSTIAQLTNSLKQSQQKISTLQQKQQQYCARLLEEGKNSNQREMKLQAQIAELSDLNHEFMESVNAKNRLIEELQENCRRKAEEMEYVAGQQKGTRQENQKLKEEVKQLKEEIQKLIRLKQEQQVRCRENEQRLSASFIDLQQKKLKGDKNLQQLLKQVHQNQQIIQQLYTKLYQLQKQLDDHHRQSTPKNQSIKQSISVSPSISDKPQNAHKEVHEFLWNLVIEQLNNNLAELTAKNEKIQQDYNQEKEENQRILREMELQYQEDRNALQTQVARLSEEVNQLENNNGVLLQQLRIKDSQMSKIYQEMAKIEEQLKQLEPIRKRMSSISEQQPQRQQSSQKQIQAQDLAEVDRKIEESEQACLQLQIQIKKQAQLQEIIRCLVDLEREKEKQVATLKTKIRIQEGQIQNMSRQIRKLNQQLKQLLDAIKAITSERDLLAQHNIQLSSMAKKSLSQDKPLLQQKITTLQDKIRLLEKQLHKQQDYDQQMMEELINVESKLKAKQFEVDKLVALLWEILGHVDGELREKYEGLVTKYRVGRCRTQ